MLSPPSPTRTSPNSGAASPTRSSRRSVSALIDLLSEAALSLNSQLDAGHVEVRMAGRDPELVFVDEPRAPEEPPSPGDDLSARITLRLPEGLKASLEVAAAREAVSTNAWIVRALARALEPRAARRSSNRLQGFAQS